MILSFQKVIPPLLDLDFLATRNMAENEGGLPAEQQEMEEDQHSSENDDESEEEDGDNEEYFEVEKLMARKKRDVSELSHLFCVDCSGMCEMLTFVLPGIFFVVRS